MAVGEECSIGCDTVLPGKSEFHEVFECADAEYCVVGMIGMMRVPVFEPDIDPVGGICAGVVRDNP